MSNLRKGNETRQSVCSQATRSCMAAGCLGRFTLLAISVIGTALPAVAEDSGYVEISSPQCESALAKSALPKRLRERAVVYLWEEDSYKVQGEGEGEGEGDFHCLVARNHPESVIPMCISASGAESVLLGEMYKASLVMNGAHISEATAAFDKAVLEGEFIPAKAPGISYMMSAHNKIYQQNNDTFWAVPAHVMMFAPYVDPESVGSATFEEAMANPGVPVASGPGIHEFIITFVAEAADSDDVYDACEIDKT